MKRRPNINVLIKSSWILIVLGVISAFISMMITFLGNYDSDKISAAGQISSSIASIFGITIAALAIWVYLEKEDKVTIQSDRAMYFKEKLQIALNDLSMYILQSLEYSSRENVPNHIIDNFNLMLLDSVVFVRDTLEECRGSELGVVLNKVEVGNHQTAYFILVILGNKLSKYTSEKKTFPELHNKLIIDLTSKLAKALNTINEHNVSELLVTHPKLDYVQSIIKIVDDDKKL